MPWKDKDILTPQALNSRTGLFFNAKDPDFGAMGDGTTDDTSALTTLESDASSAGRKVFLSQGTYLFNAANLEFVHGVELENDRTLLSNSSVSNVFSVDTHRGFTKIVGLQHNHLESVLTTSANTIGNIVAPPLSVVNNSYPVDVVAHWFNDGGLEARRVGTGGGSTKWYTWQWNHVSNTTYDPERHPLLGWYRGDEQNVLDWQCYWLNEYGVAGTNLLTRSDFTTKDWSNQTDQNHWIFQLCDNVPNFKNLKYMLVSPQAATSTAFEDATNDLVDNVYLQYNNFYSLRYKGGSYPVIFHFDGNDLRTLFGSNSNVTAFFDRVSTRFKNAGHSGVAFFARKPISNFQIDRGTLEEQTDTLYFEAGYAGNGSSDNTGSTTYDELRSSETRPVDPRRILSIPSALSSSIEHPSTFPWTGSTASQFGTWLRDTIDHVITNDMPKVVTVYNMGEWAEGGQALQPTRANGFSYLEEVKNSLIVSAGEDIRAITPPRGGSSTTVLPAPAAPTVAVQGETGSTTYSYWVVATDEHGRSTGVSSAGEVANGATPLSTTNYNHVTWAAVPNAVRYTLLKGISSAETGSLLNLTGNVFNDTGSINTQNFTNPTRNATGDLDVFGNVNISQSTGLIIFKGTAGGQSEGIQYTDSGGASRHALLFPGSNIVSLANRAANGVVQVRANAGAGSGGESVSAEFQDDAVIIGATDPGGAARLRISGTTMNLSTSAGAGPAGDSAGSTGDIAWGVDSNTSFLYVCVSEGSWMRTALTPF